MIPRDSKGAYLIETAIVIPLVLALLLSIFWFSTLLNTYIGLRWAVGEGLRLAVTRGDYRRVGGRIIPMLNDMSFTYTGQTPNPFELNAALVTLTDGSADSERLRRIFAHNLREFPEDPPPILAGQYTETFIENHSFGVFSPLAMFFGPIDFSQMPAPLLYSLAYVGETMKYTSGRDISYPCNPGGTDPNDGPGCLMCRFLNPVTLTDTPYWGPYPGGLLPFSRIVLECQYGMSLTFLAPIYQLLSLVTGQAYSEPRFIITAKKQTDVETATAWEAL